MTRVPAYVTAFHSPHRADIGNYVKPATEALLAELATNTDLVPRHQVVAIAEAAAELALAQFLTFVGARGEIDFYTGNGDEMVRFSFNPDNSRTTDGSPWRDDSKITEIQGE